MKDIIIIRLDDNGVQTLGQGFIMDGLTKLMEFKTLELPWRDNMRGTSCIKPGIYKAIKHKSPKFDKCLWLQGVEDRSEVLLHKGNYYTQIRGCILAGDGHTDINNDGEKDVTNSTKTVNAIVDLVGDNCNIIIIDLT